MSAEASRQGPLSIAVCFCINFHALLQHNLTGKCCTFLISNNKNWCFVVNEVPKNFKYENLTPKEPRGPKRSFTNFGQVPMISIKNFFFGDF